MAALVVIGAIAIIVAAKAILVVPASQRVAVIRLGRFVGIRGPGIVVLAPVIDAIVRYDLEQQELRLSGAFRTADADRTSLEAVIRYRILDPQKAYQNGVSPVDGVKESARVAIQKMAESRSGRALVDAFARQTVRESMDGITSHFGVKVLEVELAVPPA